MKKGRIEFIIMAFTAIAVLSGSCGRKEGLTVISAPAGLSAVSGDQMIALSWQPVPGAVSYKVYWGISSGNYLSSKVLMPPVANHTIDSLTNGTTYFIMVTVSDAQNESGPSKEISAVPGPSINLTMIEPSAILTPKAQKLKFYAQNCDSQTKIVIAYRGEEQVFEPGKIEAEYLELDLTASTLLKIGTSSVFLRNGSQKSNELPFYVKGAISLWEIFSTRDSYSCTGELAGGKYEIMADKLTYIGAGYCAAQGDSSAIGCNYTGFHFSWNVKFGPMGGIEQQFYDDDYKEGFSTAGAAFAYYQDKFLIISVPEMTKICAKFYDLWDGDYTDNHGSLPFIFRKIDEL